MGLLKESKTLSWTDTQKQTKTLKRRGIEYFIQAYNNADKHSMSKKFMWGEEIEQNLVIKRPVGWVLLPEASRVIKAFENADGYILNVEYSGYMVETTPSAPYNATIRQFDRVEKGIERRRKEIEKYLCKEYGNSAHVLLIPCFPLLGTPQAFSIADEYTEKEWCSKWNEEYEKECASPSGPPAFLDEQTDTEAARGRSLSFGVTRSRHFPDFAITPHRRFYNFSYNIRERRERPLHMLIDPARIGKIGTKWIPGCDPVVIDSMGQGMGCCCLQVTMQTESLKEARLLYDTLGSICPLLLYLTMATPVVSGCLTSTSTRWSIVSASVDCRKKEEEGHIKKSRYSSIDLYVSEMTDADYAFYNDINPAINADAEKQLNEGGVDYALAQHIASMYTRDPVLCYSSTTPQEDFENIQSSNWRSMRLKPPKDTDKEKEAPWLIEVRPMEIQPTSFENTAYSIFVILFSRMALSYSASFYIPISKVDDNFAAVDLPPDGEGVAEYLKEETTKQFWYRENIFDSKQAVIKKGTIRDIFLGNGEYCGILTAVENYVNEYFEKEKGVVEPYLRFIRERVTGEKTSVAGWMRSFVAAHKAYRGDSIVSREVSDALIDEIIAISQKNTTEYLKKEVEDSE